MHCYSDSQMRKLMLRKSEKVLRRMWGKVISECLLKEQFESFQRHFPAVPSQFFHCPLLCLVGAVWRAHWVCSWPSLSVAPASFQVKSLRFRKVLSNGSAAVGVLAVTDRNGENLTCVTN